MQANLEKIIEIIHFAEIYFAEFHLADKKIIGNYLAEINLFFN